MIKRIILLVMDSVGVGCLPDASDYNDTGVNTMGNIISQRGVLDIPNLGSLGMGKLVNTGCSVDRIIGSYGRMAEISPGKDTTTGHWEMAGLVLDFAFPTYPNGFPMEITEEFEKKAGISTIGNYPQSGTVIIEELGEYHLKTGRLIIYTSADSVFQIAAHEDIVPLSRLYEYCKIARSILVGKHSVGRVIARPFKGIPGKFYRNEAGRKDFSLEPPQDTVLDILKDKDFFVCGIGKIGDIFAHRGLTEEIHTDSNMDGIDKTIDALKKYKNDRGVIFVNLVEFDSVYGHRRNIEGYAAALEELDSRIPEIIKNITDEDLIIITADHGCDPTHTRHTDHTREYVPLLVYGSKIKSGVDLGTRETFSDCGQTVADIFGFKLNYGKSFKEKIVNI